MAPKKKYTQKEKEAFVDAMSDSEIYGLAVAMAPWNSSVKVNDSNVKSNVVDSDGFALGSGYRGHMHFNEMQKECWNKFVGNPHISSHVRDFMGDLTGYGFDWGSEEFAVDEAMRTMTNDIRNQLKINMSKYVGRSEIEGELFLMLTVHAKDGFVEVDFMEPTSLSGGTNGEGIYFHPVKRIWPLFYEFNLDEYDGKVEKETNVRKNAAGKRRKQKTGISKKKESSVIIPSIHVAYMSNGAVNEVIDKYTIDKNKLKYARDDSKAYKKTNGWYRFIIAWDRGFLTPRNASHIKTTIEWINHYENLKKWEIDHKKSAGAYLWVVKMTDSKTFRTWLKMTDDERAATGLTAQKTPGGTLICPPGIEVDCKNPNLPTISEQDNDIMHMITSGLNKPEDMVTGQTKGDTFSGVKASRGPQTGRTLNDIHFFELFLKDVFWRSILFLHSKYSNFKLMYKIEETVKFDNKVPKKKKVRKEAFELVEIEFPMPEISDMSSKANAYLGSKHLSVVESLGVPKEVVAKKLGITGYGKKRRKYADEIEKYPNLPLTDALDAIQEKSGEPANVHPDAPGNTPPGNTPPGNTPPGNTPPGNTPPGNNGK